MRVLWVDNLNYLNSHQWILYTKRRIKEMLVNKIRTVKQDK